MSYLIKIFNQEYIDRHAWTDLVKNSTSGTPFSLSDYNSLYINSEVFYIVAIDVISQQYIGGISGRKKGKLPIMGNLFASILVETSAIIKNTLSTDATKELKLVIYRNLIDFSRKAGVIQVFLNHWSRESQSEVLSRVGFFVENSSTFELDLLDTYTDIQNKFSGRCRTSLRKAKKSKLDCFIYFNDIPRHVLDDISDLSHNTYERAVKKHKNASMHFKKKDFYKYLFEKCRNNLEVGIVYDSEKRPISFAILLFDHHRAIYYRGGSDLEKNRATSASNLLLYNLVNSAISRKINLFDFGCVPYKPERHHPAYGVYRFKESFGGELKVYYSGYYVVNRFKYFLFNLIFSNPALKRFVNKIIKG